MADELDGRIQEIERSLAALESQVREQTARTQLGTRTILVIGILVIAVLFVSLTLLAREIRDEMQPKILAETVQSLTSTKIIPALGETMKKNAPVIVESLRTGIMKEVPVLREMAEKKALALVDVVADKLDERMDDMVAKVIEAHRQELEPLVKAAATASDATKLQKVFRDSLEELIGPKMDEALKGFDEYATGMEHRLDHLKQPDSKLNSDEKLEKALIVSATEFMDQAMKDAGVTPDTTKSAPAVKP